MLQFTSCLKKEIDTKIEQIERSEISMITKSLEANKHQRFKIVGFERIDETGRKFFQS